MSRLILSCTEVPGRGYPLLLLEHGLEGWLHLRGDLCYNEINTSDCLRKLQLSKWLESGASSWL